MLNCRPFRSRSQHERTEDCAFRRRASEQWHESVTAYQDAVLLLAQHRDYEAVYKSAETLRLLSLEIMQILEDHEREHGCGVSQDRTHQPVLLSDEKATPRSNPMVRKLFQFSMGGL